MAIPYKKVPGKIPVGSRLVKMLGLGAATLAISTIAYFEGYVPEAYRDPVGILTKCFGDTTNVAPGQTYTFEECTRSLNEHVARNTAPILNCVPELEFAPDKVKAAAASMSYNIGPTAFCKSSVAQYFNTGEWERGCRRIAEIYKTAKGVPLKGLEIRRSFESELCLQGLREGR